MSSLELVPTLIPVDITYPEGADRYWSERDSGPWDSEADAYRVILGDLPAVILRAPFYNLCGYIGVPPGHPWHGASAYSDELPSVHGGWTIASENPICDEASGLVGGGIWWFGFDCGHWGDYQPAMNSILRSAGVTDELHGDPGGYKPAPWVAGELFDVAPAFTSTREQRLGVLGPVPQI